MRIIVDTNIAFSAILNSTSKIGSIILQPRTKFNFYSTEQLRKEIEDHRSKIKKISKYSDFELDRIISLITGKIRFINIKLISKRSFEYAESLTKDVDIDDSEFVALTEHIKGKLWSGDKQLIEGLREKGWKKVISIEDLFKTIFEIYRQ